MKPIDKDRLEKAIQDNIAAINLGNATIIQLEDAIAQQKETILKCQGAINMLNALIVEIDAEVEQFFKEASVRHNPPAIAGGFIGKTTIQNPTLQSSNGDYTMEG